MLWFQGYFNYTVLYYGGYSPDSFMGLLRYNIQLAYFFTISAYMVLCGASIIYRSVNLKNDLNPNLKPWPLIVILKP